MTHGSDPLAGAVAPDTVALAIFRFAGAIGASSVVLAWHLLPETLPAGRQINVSAARFLTRYASIIREPIFRTHAAYADSAAALMGVFQFMLGASSGLLAGLLTDGTPRGLALLMFLGMLCAAAVDLVRPKM